MLFFVLLALSGAGAVHFVPESVFELHAGLAGQEYLFDKVQQLKKYQLPSVLEEFLRSNFSSAQETLSIVCYEELRYLGYGLAGLKSAYEAGGHDFSFTADQKWKLLVPIMDSSAKIGPGIARGHLQHSGHFAQCKRVKHFSKELGRNIEGDYYRVQLDLRLRPFGLNESCGIPQIGMDLCLPVSCRRDNLTQFFRNAFQTPNSSPVCNVKHVNEDVPPVVPMTMIVAYTFLLIFVFCVTAGVIDYYQPQNLSAQKKTSISWEMFMAFSFLQSAKQIFKTEGTQKEGQINSLHCIRVISTIWVIVRSCRCHNNHYYLREYSSLVLSNAYFAVDTFFFLSGLLLSFQWFKALKKNRKAVMSPGGWVMLYLHRVLRLSPPYYATILFYSFVFTSMLHDMPKFLTPNIHIDQCRSNFYLNLLYVNNLIDPANICYVVSWYLATDLQIFLLTPLLLAPFALFGGLAGFFVAFLCLVLSTVGNFLTVMKFHFPPSEFQFGPKDPEASTKNYTLWNYYQPLIRCQVYIMGVVVGYVLQKVPRWRINPVLNAVLWVFSLASMVAVVCWLHSYTEGVFWSPVMRATYSSFSRIVWGAGLAWICTSTFYTKGVIGDFMSLPFWAPIGRLCYTAYLVHIMVVIYYFGANFADTYFISLPHMVFCG
ncbi:unnamed protein product [Caenorhabditis auriculariae]|uniref:Nose resistant-to-fluoxetine protein N-terminal domain-containing protein n=1 Tax=Caenorhabditis auriculariae TaxID=2777116 RepID=A0A8S1HI48_9PELO|nr:unnamed protein product [Caenorhabditis auriculariae]